jgi:arginine:ornithine antiporter/lysine permease
MSLLVIHLTRAGYLDIILAAVPMVIVPYLCSSAYSSLLCIKGETFEHGPKHIKYKVLAISVISFVYCSWALYASTIHNVTSTLILFGVGTVVYVVMKMPAL